MNGSLHIDNENMDKLYDTICACTDSETAYTVYAALQIAANRMTDKDLEYWGRLAKKNILSYKEER